MAPTGTRKRRKSGTFGGNGTRTPHDLLASDTETGGHWFTEDGVSLERRMNGLKITSVAIWAIAGGVMAIILILNLSQTPSMDWAQWVLPLIIIAVGWFLGLNYYRMAQQMEPYEFYENGIKSSPAFSNRTRFTSYGDISSIEKDIYGRYVLKRGYRNRVVATIYPNSRTGRHLDRIKEKTDRHFRIQKGVPTRQ